MCSLQIWLSYQALWDLQADYLYGKLGSGLECWMKALEDIKYAYVQFLFLVANCTISVELELHFVQKVCFKTDAVC